MDLQHVLTRNGSVIEEKSFNDVLDGSHQKFQHGLRFVKCEFEKDVNFTGIEVPFIEFVECTFKSRLILEKAKIHHHFHLSFEKIDKDIECKCISAFLAGSSRQDLEVILSEAELGSLEIIHAGAGASVLTHLNAQRVSIMQTVAIKKSFITGRLDFEGARIGCNLEVEGCCLYREPNSDSSPTTKDDCDHILYNPSYHQEIAAVWLRDAEIRGRLRIIDTTFCNSILYMSSAEISSSIECIRVKFEGNLPWSILGANLEVRASFALHDICVKVGEDSDKYDYDKGVICLDNAEIDGNLEIKPLPDRSKSDESESADKPKPPLLTTIRCPYMRVGGNFTLCRGTLYGGILARGAVIQGSLNLRNTKFLSRKRSDSNHDSVQWALDIRDAEVGGDVLLGFDFKTGDLRRETQSDEKSYESQGNVRIERPLCLIGARIGRNLSLDRTLILGQEDRLNRSILAPAIRLGGNLYIRGSYVKGGVDLRNSQAQMVDFRASVLAYDDKDEEIESPEKRWPALSMRRARVFLDLTFCDVDYPYLPDQKRVDPCFECKGRVNLEGLRIEGYLRMYNSVFKRLINAKNLQVGQDIEMLDVTMDSHVDMSGAMVGGSVGFPKISGRNITEPQQRSERDERIKIKSINFSNSHIHQNIALQHCKVTENLTLTLAQIGGDFLFFKGSVEGTLYLDRAHIQGNLVCESSEIGSSKDKLSSQIKDSASYCLYAANAEVSKNVMIGRNGTFHGSVSFAAAKVSGNFDASGSKFYHCLYAAEISVGRSVFLSCDDEGRRFEAQGEVNYENAQVSGNFDCRGGDFQCKEFSLCMQGSHITGNVYLGALDNNTNRDKWLTFSAAGTVRIDKATIMGNLDCRGGHFGKSPPGQVADKASPRNYCLYALVAQIQGNVFLGSSAQQLPQQSAQQVKYGFDGWINFAAAKIMARFDCRGGRFGVGERAFYAPQIEVGRHVYFSVLKNEQGKLIQFESSGTIDISGAIISGNLDCGGAHLKCDEGYSFIARHAKVSGTVFFNEPLHLKSESENTEDSQSFVSEREVDLSGIHIGRRLNCSNAKIASFFANSGYIGESLILDGCEATSVEIKGIQLAGELKCQGNCKIRVIHAEDAKVEQQVSINIQNEQPITLHFSGLQVNGDCELSACFEELNLSQARIEGRLTLRGNFGVTRNSSQSNTNSNNQDNTNNKTKNSGDSQKRIYNFLREVIEPINFKLERNLVIDQTGNHKCIVNLTSANVVEWDDRIIPQLCRTSEFGDGTLIKFMSSYNFSDFVYQKIGSEISNLLRSPAKCGKGSELLGRWLNYSNGGQYNPQPYEQMASVLRKSGYDDAWGEILIAKRRAYREQAGTGINLKMFLLTVFSVAMVLFSFSDLFYIAGKPLLDRGALYSLLLGNYKALLDLGVHCVLLISAISLFSYLIINLLFTFTKFRRYLVLINKMILDEITVEIPVKLAARPWKTPAYLFLLWIFFGTLYTVLDARGSMVPAESEVIYAVHERYHTNLAFEEILRDTGYPEFQPYAYVFDRLIPIVQLDQTAFWTSSDSRLGGTFFLLTDRLMTIISFYLITVFVGNLTGLLRIEKM